MAEEQQCALGEFAGRIPGPSKSRNPSSTPPCRRATPDFASALLCRRPLGRTAVDAPGLAGDVPRGVGGDEVGDANDLVRFGEASGGLVVAAVTGCAGCASVGRAARDCRPDAPMPQPMSETSFAPDVRSVSRTARSIWSRCSRRNPLVATSLSRAHGQLALQPLVRLVHLAQGVWSRQPPSLTPARELPRCPAHRRCTSTRRRSDRRCGPVRAMP